MSNVLIACEESGASREAFAALGHRAVSADILPTAVAPSATADHHQGDVFDVLDDPGRWFDGPIDLMISHPPCTYLSGSGARWLTQVPANPKPGVLYGPARRVAQAEAVEFARRLWEADVPRVMIENPVSMLSSLWRRPDQTIQPWQFGHGEVKATCLWLRGLPPLAHTRVLPEVDPVTGESNRKAIVHRMSPGPERQKLRSRTYPGIAAAMAAQWGPLLDRAEGAA